MSDNQEKGEGGCTVIQVDKIQTRTGKMTRGLLFWPTLENKQIRFFRCLLFLAARHSICSSSQPCWFTTATCTQDTSSRTAVARPRLTSPSALSGFGCQTTRCGKPACTRSCLPTLTCFSTRGCKDWTSFCTQKSNRQLWFPAIVMLKLQKVQGTFCYTADGEMKVTFWFWVQKEEDPNPSKHFDIWDKKEERLNITDAWSWCFFQFSGPQGVPGFCLVLHIMKRVWSRIFQNGLYLLHYSIPRSVCHLIWI